jgi:hypothetical protein
MGITHVNSSRMGLLKDTLIGIRTTQNHAFGEWSILLGKALCPCY